MTAIIVATDGSLSSERAIHICADVAKARRADVIVVSVIDDSPIPDEIRMMAEAEHLVDRTPQVHGAHASNIPLWVMDDVHAAAQAEQNIEIRRTISRLALEKARDILGAADISAVTERVIEGNAVDAIVATAKQEKAEMIVIIFAMVLGEFSFTKPAPPPICTTSVDIAKKDNNNMMAK